jgi:hypothetical protein
MARLMASGATDAIVAEWFQRVSLCEQRGQRELEAVTRIQAATRGFLVRRRLQRLT